jgi:alpha/beta superfamily hydrolase
MIAESATTVTAADGVTLEARVAIPASPRAGLVCCHPHPLYGGDMDNPVVVRATEVCAALGFATLRFNFRGVGGSTGAHGEGRAETQDVQAALAHLQGSLGPGRPLALAGYSFGAVVASRVTTAGISTAAGPDALALIAPPMARTGEEPFVGLAGFPAPLLIAAGTQDEYCPRPMLEALAQRLPGATLSIIEGANHFFFGKLYPLGEAVEAWARALEAGKPGRSRRTG